jgi:hypothetical protein
VQLQISNISVDSIRAAHAISSLLDRRPVSPVDNEYLNKVAARFSVVPIAGIHLFLDCRGQHFRSTFR